MDYLHRYTVEAASPVRHERGEKGEPPATGERRPAEWYASQADILPYATSLEWDFDGGGTIDFVPAGQQGSTYAPLVNSFNWPNFYERLGGGVLLDAVRLHVKAEYDYVLIDSRTGVSDTSGICTVLLPDVLVVCFTLNNQSINGAAAVTESVARQRKNPDGSSNIRILPVPMRTDPFEKERLNRRRLLARRRFAVWASDAAYWNDVELPYEPYYSYEETLATFVDEPGNPRSMLSSLERLAAHATGLPGIRLVPPPPKRRDQVLRLLRPSSACSALRDARCTPWRAHRTTGPRGPRVSREPDLPPLPRRVGRHEPARARPRVKQPDIGRVSGVSVGHVSRGKTPSRFGHHWP